MRTHLSHLVHVWACSLMLLPAACAQSGELPTDPPGEVPEQPKEDLGEAAEMIELLAAIKKDAADEALDSLMTNLDLADRETRSLRASFRHLSENFIAGVTETRDGTLTLLTDHDDGHASGLPLRQFRVDFTSLILEQRISELNKSLLFDGVWLAERIEDEKQFNKWQLVPPGERFDPMDKPGGSSVWLPIGQDAAKLRERYHALIVPAEDYFAGNEMGGLLRGTMMPNENTTPPQPGTVQLRLIPKDKQDPTDEIRMWFDEVTFLPRAQAVLDGEGIQFSVLFGVVQNPEDVDAKLFDTTTPPAAEGWNVTVRPWREGAGN